MKNYTENRNEVDWKDIILPLTEAAKYLASNKGWFRGQHTDSFLKGKEAKDYAQDAILSYIEHPEKYDPTKGTLLKYLIYNVMRTMISNDLKAKENRTSNSEEYLDRIKIKEDKEISKYTEIIYLNREMYISEDIDPAAIIDEIEEAIKHDEILQEILICIKDGEHPREKHHEIFKRDYSVYDNGIRRIKTIAKNIAKKYNVKSLKL